MLPSESTGFEVDLRAGPDAARTARRFVHEHSESLPADVVADAELLVSELVTNAVRHGRPGITLSVALEPPLIGVSVTDMGEELPPSTAGDPGATATSGRGLVIIDRMSSAWGVIPNDPPPGKTVWFRLNPS